MLQSLHVHNFALIEDAKIDFAPGFNIFTGETGAGKSILIDALASCWVIGLRRTISAAELDSFWVQAVFDISGIEAVKSLLAEQGIDEEDELFLRRRILATAKARLQLTACRYHWQYSKASANFWSIFMASMKTRRF